MSISDRQYGILEILKQRNYITVNELASITFTSPSSIRRDLSALQNKGLVKRRHGGAELPEMTNGVASFGDRITKNVAEKRLIAKEASRLLQNGQTILLDSSSTVSFLLPHIAKCNGITLFTNSIYTAAKAIELNINTNLIGGHSVNKSMALSGPIAYRALKEIRPDILFFSSQSVDENGVITDSTEEENYIRTIMLEVSKTKVFLCDSTKFNTRSNYVLTSTYQIDYSFFDKPFR